MTPLDPVAVAWFREQAEKLLASDDRARFVLWKTWALDQADAVLAFHADWERRGQALADADDKLLGLIDEIQRVPTLNATHLLDTLTAARSLLAGETG